MGSFLPESTLSLLLLLLLPLPHPNLSGWNEI
jgi:hypothetical protein